MRKEHLERLGIAAAILLLPGGFVLGATLAAREWRKRRAGSLDADPIDAAGPRVDAPMPDRAP